MKKLACLALTLLVAACGGPDETDTDSDPILIEATFSSIHANLLRRRCTAGPCHDNSSPAAGLSFMSAEAAYTALINQPADINPHKMLVVPGEPGASFLVAKLRGELEEDEGDPMPFLNGTLPVSVIATIEAWIAAGAPNN